MRTSNVRLSYAHRKGIIFFLLFVLAAVLIVLYFFLTRAVIVITPHVRQISTDFIVEVGSSVPGENSVFADTRMESKIIEKTEKFMATGKKTIEPVLSGDTLGKILLVNKLDTPMDLVPKTRLLNDQGVLIRLKDRVTIPAGGTFEAVVYADDMNSFSILDIGKLRLPGLSTALQEKVYAENRVKISKEKRDIDVIEKQDLENAVVDLSTKMRQEAINDIKLMYSSDGPIVLAVVTEVIEKTSNKPIGAEAVDFSTTVKMQVVSVFLDKSELNTLIDTRLREALKVGERIEKLDFGAGKYVIEEYDLAKKTARINVHAVAQIKMDENHPILDKEKIIGANKKQVEIYFKSFDEVKDVRVMFTPFWVNRVPRILDKIEISVE